jgi:hypothetical protein
MTMNNQEIMANLNLHAVLQNIEELTVLDREAADMVKNWDLCIRFAVRKGPRAFLSFSGGRCIYSEDPVRKPTISLFFLSHEHCNKMFENKAAPLILKGFTRLGFLLKDFPMLTKRLEYYLKPAEGLLSDKKFLEINTRMTLNTAVYAARDLARCEENSIMNAEQIGIGTMMIKVLPSGPVVTIDFGKKAITVKKEEISRPRCALYFKNVKIANDFFNGRIDTYSAVACGDVAIRGIALMLDSMAMILNRIPKYLS